MGWIPTTYRHEWSDAGACERTISNGRGTPTARVLLPYDAAKPGRQCAELTLRNMHDRIVKEVEGGHEFELDAYRKLAYTHADVYGDEGGGLKTTLQMDRAPGEWHLQFDLALPIGAEAHYQPRPSRAEIDDGVDMPENVVGSYAIYKAGNKLAHLYRSFVTDAKGDMRWCDMQLVDGVLTVQLPRAWMESAEREWPVVFDPYMGYNTVGGTTHTWIADRVHACGKSAPISDASATKIEVYVTTSTTNGRTFGIYSDSSGPDALLERTGEDTQAGTGWLGVNLDSPLAILSSENYWLCSWQGINYSGKRDNIGADSMYYKDGQTYVGGTMPSPFPASPFTLVYEYSIRCFYEAAGGTSASLVDGGLVNRGLVDGGLVR